jgi:hypothetical protein
MAYMNNKGDKIGSLDVAISNDNVVAINRLDDVTTVTVRESRHGQGHGGDSWRFAIWEVRRLLQLRVLRLGFLQDGDVGSAGLQCLSFSRDSPTSSQGSCTSRA